MMQDRICRECSCSFLGGPRAYYCLLCRAERQRIQGAAGKARERAGLTRKIGSSDTCERCNNTYTINGSLQRFCQDCQPIHALEYDRETSLPVYYDRKNELNPIRNERRRQGMRNCDWCDKEHPIMVGAPTTCSDECKQKLKNHKWNEWNKSKETKKAPDL